MINKTVLYIAGYGRSGSTLLARILGSHPNIYNAGELINFLNLLTNDDAICSCQQKLQNCEFWSDIFRRFTSGIRSDINKLQLSQQRHESFSYFYRNIVKRSKTDAVLYSHLIQTLIMSISANLSPHVQYIIDSSKTTWNRFFRPLSIAKMAGVRVKLIHIVRDGRGCIWSNIKGTDDGMLRGPILKDKGSFPVLRTTLHWPFANFGAHIFQKTSLSEDYCRIRYEDFVENPRIILTQLGNFLGLSFDEQFEFITSGGYLPLGHMIAGNRLRSTAQIIIKSDMEWKRYLNKPSQLLFLFFNWPLSFIYGYI